MVAMRCLAGRQRLSQGVEPCRSCSSALRLRRDWPKGPRNSTRQRGTASKKGWGEEKTRHLKTLTEWKVAEAHKAKVAVTDVRPKPGVERCLPNAAEPAQSW